jgi:peptidoglycan/xylan/chitin deacetylase (PgdA/CDA1 family)
MLIARTPALLKKIYYSLKWDLRRDDNAIYLTFDDGPTPGVTEEVLNILHQFNARATFFCIGRNVERYPHLFSRIINEGHSAGNHTYSHLNGWTTKNREYFQDIETAGLLIKSLLFRPPYGKIRRSQIKYLCKKYIIIMWDIISYDFSPDVSKEKCLNNVLDRIRPGAIIVFHDSIKAADRMLFALPRILEYSVTNNLHCKAIEL